LTGNNDHGECISIGLLHFLVVCNFLRIWKINKLLNVKKSVTLLLKILKNIFKTFS